MFATVLVFGRRQRRDGPRAQLAGVLTCHPLSLSSQPATGPSALARAQRARAQRLCADPKWSYGPASLGYHASIVAHSNPVSPLRAHDRLSASARHKSSRVQ